MTPPEADARVKLWSAIDYYADSYPRVPSGMRERAVDAVNVALARLVEEEERRVRDRIAAQVVAWMALNVYASASSSKLVESIRSRPASEPGQTSEEASL